MFGQHQRLPEFNSLPLPVPLHLQAGLHAQAGRSVTSCLTLYVQAASLCLLNIACTAIMNGLEVLHTHAVSALVPEVSCMLQELADAEARAQQGLANIPETSKTSAYQAWLGFYNSFKSKLRWSPAELVQQANYFSQTIGQCPYTVTTTFSFSLFHFFRICCCVKCS